VSFRYPVTLDLDGRRCVVIGGGTVAAHKARGLLEAGAVVAVVAERPAEDLEQLAGDARVELSRRRYVYGDLEGAFLAVAATDDPTVNAEVFKEADERGVLLNAVDDAEHCHFAVPSVLRRGDLTVAISTAGKAPALSKRLRAELSERLGPELATVVDVLGEVRAEALTARTVDFDTWAERWQGALEHDVVDLVRQGRLPEAKDLVRRSLDGLSDRASPGPRGRVAIVGAGPGDPGLLTVRGQQLLAGADVVVHDRLVDPSLLEGKTAVFVGKEAGHHAVPQAEINDLLVDLAGQGKSVVRLKGGDPLVFGRGGEEAVALAEAGVDFEIVPAPTSAIAALAYAGIPVTDRRLSSSVALVTGHCTGDREVDWRALGTAVDTVVVLMGLARLPEISRLLVQGGRDPATPAAVVENGTRPDQRVVTAELARLPDAAAEAELRSPAVVVVGEVVRLRDRMAWFVEAGPKAKKVDRNS
jgi:uroporphyrin-III C-methyltransferase/precorrin-2 dehydrogenase/sirohydrochlorin ferrochelatase